MENKNYYWPNLTRDPNDRFDPDMIFRHFVQAKGNLLAIVGKDGCPDSYRGLKDYNKKYNFRKHYELHLESLARINNPLDSYDISSAKKEKNTEQKLEKILDALLDKISPKYVVNEETHLVEEVWEVPPTSFERSAPVAISLAKELRERRQNTTDYDLMKKVVVKNVEDCVKDIVLLLQKASNSRLISTGAMCTLINEIKNMLNGRKLTLELSGQEQKATSIDVNKHQEESNENNIKASSG